MDSRAEIEDWYKVICTAIDNVRSLDRKYSTSTVRCVNGYAPACQYGPLTQNIRF
jgi:hypothetical protein